MSLTKKYPSMFMSILIIVGTYFISNSVLAGVEVGNGGDAIVCRDKQGKIKGKPELLDYYEARVNFGWKIKESGTREQILNRFLERIESINSYNKTEYRERAHQFFSEANFLNDIELVDIPDSNHTTLPRDCKVEQLVIQKNNLLPGEKRYIINKEIWDLLDTVSQAGTIVHEIFYRDSLHSTSRYVRFFNGKVAANNLKDLSPNAKNKLFRNLNIEKFVVPPSSAIIEYLTFDTSGNPISLMIDSRGDLFEGVKLNGSFQVIYTKDEIRITTKGKAGTQQVSLPITNEIVQATDTILYRSGALKEIYDPRGLEHKSHFKLFSNILRQHINCYGKFKNFQKYQPSIGFFQNGDLNFCLTDLSSISHETPYYQATFYALPSPKIEYNLLYINKLGYIQYESLGLDVESFVANGAFTIQGNWHEMVNVGIRDSGLPGFGEFIHPTTLIYNTIPYNTVQSSKVYFYPNGSLHAGKLKEKSILTYEGHPISFRSKHVCPFYAKSSRHLYVKSNTGFGVVDIFDDGDFVELSEGGQLTEAVVDAKTDFQLNGKIYHLEENDVIDLKWKEGKLTHLQSTSIECEKK